MAFIGPYNLIVPAGVLANSSEVFAVLDPDAGGASTFSVRLSASGVEPATHFGARTMLEQQTVTALQTMTVTQFKDYVNGLATSRGRNGVQSATAFKNSLLMDNTMNFWEFVTASGLKHIAPADA